MDPIEGLLQSKPGLSYPSHQSSEQAHSHLPQPQPKDIEKVRKFTSREEEWQETKSETRAIERALIWELGKLIRFLLYHRVLK